MSRGIEKFLSEDRPEQYYSGLTAELEKLNGRLHMFSSINKGISSGFPFSVKENICVEGVESTASSRILQGYVPPFDATAVARMRKARFGFIGKTRMDEFGFGTFGLNCEQHPVNPFDERYVAGGSSAGAAVAASVMANHVSIAESTGGSISCPAAFCGVVGFTPTYGIVSRYGIIDYANSLDKIGVLARSSADARYVLDIVKGSDAYDTTCADHKLGGRDHRKLVVIDQLMKGVDQKVLGPFGKLLSRLENAGYSVEHRSIPFIDKAIPAYYIISMAEASTNLAKYTGFKYGLKVGDFSRGYNEFFTDARSSFSLEAKRRIVLGTFVRSASVKSRYYEKALKLRSMLIEALNSVLKDGFIVSPTMPITVPTIKEAGQIGPVGEYSMDYLTVPPNLAGLPHVSFPYDYVQGLPLGAQVVAGHFSDYALLDFVGKWEEKFDYRFKYNVGAL